MNKMGPNPKTMPFEKLERFAFQWKECADADRKYFLNQIRRYVLSHHLHRVTFWAFMRHHAWLRNNRGKTIKYMYFNEHHQTIGWCMYFKNWMLQAYERVNEAVCDPVFKNEPLDHLP